MNIIIIFVIAILLMCLSSVGLREGWHEWVTDIWKKVNLVGWSPMRSGAPYRYNSLIRMPYGYGTDRSMMMYFSNYERDMPKQYRDCTTYSCRTRKHNGMTAKPQDSGSRALHSGPTNARSISEKYYHNPVEYCRKNPHKYPCPNHWIKDKNQTRLAMELRNPVSFRIPAMKKRVKPQVKTFCRV